MKISMQNYSMSSSFQYLNWGLEYLIHRIWYQAEFRISATNQYVILGHGLQEHKGAMITRSHKTISEQSVVIIDDPQVCLRGFSRSQSHLDDEERRADGDYRSIKYWMSPYCAFSTEATHSLCRRRILKRRELVGGLGAGMEDGKRRRHQHVLGKQPETASLLRYLTWGGAGTRY